MSTVRVGGVRFRIYPQDHEPIHVHGRYAETVVVVEFLADGTVRIARRKDAILPSNAKRTDVRKVLETAAEYYGEIVAAWEQMK
ncbi:MAG TPA: DUF4160 domain-containing protein [Candidatus Baltobacteraceae bacterium]|nr:DUF4160 domain-containing protein [Candidatus Baltobacteraceae bacterium]